jgi:hypothetical protein
MKVYNELTLEEFIKEFEGAGRGGSFSQEGFEALFDYIEGLERDLGYNPYSFSDGLDVIAIDCDIDEMSLDDLDGYEYDEIAKLGNGNLLVRMY